MSCNHNGKTYSQGSLVCANGRELRCDGDYWSETGYSCFTNTEVINEEDYYKISSDQLTFIQNTFEKELNKVNNQDIPESANLGCVRIILSGSMNKIRIFNQCSTCKIAFLSWSNGDPDRVRIAAQGCVDVPTKAQAMQIVGEADC